MLKISKATTPGRRHLVSVDRSELYKGEPEKSLLVPGHKKRQGRGFKGHVTVRHRGGGVKKRLRIIDWKRDKRDIVGRVERLEYDPMRSANIALVIYADGEKRYMLAPNNLKAGDKVVAGQQVEPSVGNALPLKNVPVGTPIHNIELRIGKGGQLVRGAGVSAMVQSKEGAFVAVLMPSKEIRLINSECFATIGQVGNLDHKNQQLGKAGRKRMMGIRPTVRGTAQHPDSHPHGGGEGRSGVGLKFSKTPWGRPAMGKKTRKKNHVNNKFIIRDRRSK